MFNYPVNHPFLCQIRGVLVLNTYNGTLVLLKMILICFYNKIGLFSRPSRLLKERDIEQITSSKKRLTAKSSHNLRFKR